jgi:pimeloyl-ACP methyl ester carboxylesterase
VAGREVDDAFAESFLAKLPSEPAARSRRQPATAADPDGPGPPMLNEDRAFGRTLAPSDEFAVVYRDQRGCGRSLRSPVVLSLDATVADAERLLAVLGDRLGRPPVVAGFSMAATIAAVVAARRPSLMTGLVGVGMDIDGSAIEKNAYDFALDAAYARKNRRAIRHLEAIGSPPHLRASQFATRSRSCMDFGGVRRGDTYQRFSR